MKRILIVLCLLAIAALAHAKTENDIACEQQLTARFVNNKPHVFVNCATLADGVLMRPAREIDVTSRLTAQQLNGVNTLLTSLRTFAATVEAIPTPTP